MFGQKITPSDASALAPRVTDIEAAIIELTTDLTEQSYIHAKYPPAPLVACKGDSNGTTGNGTDDTLALQELSDFCQTNKRTLFLDDGIYRITANVYLKCSTVGSSPNSAVIFNDGTGDAVTIATNKYYQVFKDFSVVGNANSRDGIVNCIALVDGELWDCSYAVFDNIISERHGRHGLLHQRSWDTKYHRCKFQYNGGLGAWFTGGDQNTFNSMVLASCDFRFNGGSDNRTFNENYGGLKIECCTSFKISGCGFEGNNAWAIILKGDLPSAIIDIDNIHTEYNGNDSSIGGNIYIGGNNSTKNIHVHDSYICYGSDDGSITNYVFYLDTDLPAGTLTTNNNFYSPYTVAGIFQNRPYVIDIKSVIINTVSYGVIGNISTSLVVSAQATPNMSVKCSGGSLFMSAGVGYSAIANNNITVTESDTTNPRIDLIYINSLGVISYLAGTSSATPSCPTVPTGGFKLAEIYVGTNVTEINAANITMRRKTLDAEDWFPLTLKNGWVAYDTERTPMIRRLTNGTVEIKGLIKNGISGQGICNLPSGYTPLPYRTLILPMFFAGGCGHAEIGTEIIPYGSNTSYVSLDNFRWTRN